VLVKEALTAYNWSTATEIDNAAFEVEKSRDGINFSTCGSVQGAGNSAVTQNYSFVDASPFYETLFTVLNRSTLTETINIPILYL
jgi:hypothetical protein